MLSSQMEMNWKEAVRRNFVFLTENMIMCDIIDHLVVAKLICQDEMEVIQHMQNKHQKNMYFLSLLMRRGTTQDNAFEQFLGVLRNPSTNHKHIADQLCSHDGETVGVMQRQESAATECNSLWRIKCKNSFSTLCEQMTKVERVACHLFQANAIELQDLEIIFCTQTMTEKATRLLHILLAKRCDESFEALIQALRDTDQAFMVNSLNFVAITTHDTERQEMEGRDK